MHDVRKKFSFRARMRSFTFAFHGLGRLIRNEHNARIHLVAALLAIGMAIWCRLPAGEWGVILLCIGLVFSMEAMNTAIEKLVDLVSPEQNPKAGTIKDMSAAAVLVSALIALATGLVIFVPHLSRILKITG